MRRGIARRACFLLLAVLVSLGSSSCSQYVGYDDFYAGEPITPEDIESLYASVAGQSGVEEDGSSEGSDVATVYWTSGGSVYHTDPTCGHYADSSEQNQGTIDIAIKLGKKALCSACQKRQDAENGGDNSNDKGTSKGDNVYDIP